MQDKRVFFSWGRVSNTCFIWMVSNKSKLSLFFHMFHNIIWIRQRFTLVYYQSLSGYVQDVNVFISGSNTQEFCLVTVLANCRVGCRLIDTAGDIILIRRPSYYRPWHAKSRSRPGLLMQHLIKGAHSNMSLIAKIMCFPKALNSLHIISETLKLNLRDVNEIMNLNLE